MTTHKPRAIRVPDTEWEAALHAAKKSGTTVTAVVRAALREVVRREQAEGER